MPEPSCRKSSCQLYPRLGRNLLKRNRRLSKPRTSLSRKHQGLSRMKIFLPFLSLIFLGCAEKNSVSNPCEEFLQNHPEVVNRYEQVECLDSSTIFYELSFVKGYVFFAKFNQDSMWTTQVGNYSLPSFPVRDLEKWDVMTSRSNHGRKYTEAEKKTHKSRHFVSNFFKKQKEFF